MQARNTLQLPFVGDEVAHNKCTKRWEWDILRDGTSSKLLANGPPVICSSYMCMWWKQFKVLCATRKCLNHRLVFFFKRQYEAGFNIVDDWEVKSWYFLNTTAGQKELWGKMREGKYLSGITALTFHLCLCLNAILTWLSVSSNFCCFILFASLTFFSCAFVF